MEPIPNGPPRVLLVDDNPRLAPLVTRLLNHLGFEHVEVAADAEAARVVLASLPVCLMLCDLELPGQGSGLDLLRWCRENESLAQVPFVICEETFEFEDVIAASELGANGILLKPYDSDLFRRKIRQAVLDAARGRRARPRARPRAGGSGFEAPRTFAQSLYGMAENQTA